MELKKNQCPECQGQGPLRQFSIGSWGVLVFCEDCLSVFEKTNKEEEWKKSAIPLPTKDKTLFFLFKVIR